MSMMSLILYFVSARAGSVLMNRFKTGSNGWQNQITDIIDIH